MTNRQVNPLYFWLGVIAVAAFPLMAQMGVPWYLCLALAALALSPLFVSVAIGLATGTVQARLRQRRRKKNGAPVCGKCGYDLRASPERCPECGAPVDPMDGALVRYFQNVQATEGPTRFRVRHRRGGAAARG